MVGLASSRQMFTNDVMLNKNIVHGVATCT